MVTRINAIQGWIPRLLWTVSLGVVVTRVPLEYDVTGTVIAHGNLLTQY